MSKKQYAILMERRPIQDDIYLYFPEYLIKGELIVEEDDEYFKDELNNNYYKMDDYQTMMESPKVVVGYIVDEDDLLKKYLNTSLEKAKVLYYEDFLNKIFYGFYSINEDKLVIKEVDLLELSNKLNENYDNFGSGQINHLEDPEPIEVEIIISKPEVKEKTKKDDNNVKAKRIKVKEMKEFMDSKIIGQNEAKKDVISAIFMNFISEDYKNKNSCLLIGPTGSGKTMIAETVAEYLNLPVVIVDTTQLTIPGYVGGDIEDYLIRLLDQSNGDLEKAEQGIVVFDELDKKGSENNADVSGKGVLNILLPFMQGTEYNFKYNGKNVTFDSSKLTVFATGAFTDVAKAKEQYSSYKGGNIGFNAESNVKKEDIKYETLKIEDICKYGHMPIELLGRFTTISQLSGHTIESLRTILTESSSSALLSEKYKLSKLGVRLKYSNGFLDAVANKALELKTGARSLKTTVESAVKEARWHILENPDEYKALLLTKYTVEDNLDCVLIDNCGNSHKLKDLLKKEEKVLRLTK